MKLCAAQTLAIKGDIGKNIDKHLRLAELAFTGGADFILFPELSLTGYEPELAQELAMDPMDARLDVFQQFSDRHRVTLGLGAPIRSIRGIYISLVFFQPDEPRQVYSKQYLHQDEDPFFIPGKGQIYLVNGIHKISPALCYEISKPDHADQAVKNGASIYVASVAKSAQGVDKAEQRLTEIARQYSIPVVMSNCIGFCDHFIAAGRSSVWNEEGERVGQLSDTQEGVLIFDTGTGEVWEKAL